MRRFLFFSLPVFVLGSFAAAGQDRKEPQTPPLRHDIVVSATRIETPAREIASSVTVITRRDLENSGRTSVLEVLRDVVGLTVFQNGGPGSASSVFVRGANSEHVRVMLDGVEINDPMNPSRSFDFAHLPLDSIDRIEILRGPQSPLYGSDALGGVIQILTRSGQGKPRLSFSTQGGSFKTIGSALGFSGSTTRASYSLSLSQFATEGISAASTAYSGNTEKDEYRNLTLAGRLGFDLGGQWRTDLIVRATTAKTDLDNYGGPGGDDPNNTQNYQSFFLRTEVRGLLARNRWEQKLGFAFVRTLRTHDNPTDALHPFDSERGRFEGGLAKIDWQNTIFLHQNHTLLFGADISREAGESEYVSMSAFGAYESPFPHQSAGLAGFFVQDQVRIGGRFFAAIGARFDHHTRAGDALTYRIAPAYVFEGTQTKLKATLGTGFKSPSLYQIYAPRTFWGPIGNIDLKPEQSTGWDMGIEQPFFHGSAALGLTYFRNDFRNLIDFDFSRGYINIGRARTRGVEISGEADAGDGLRGRVSYTRLEARDLDSASDLLRRPKDKLTASITWSFAKSWSSDFAVSYAGRRADKDFTDWAGRDVVLKSYTLLDASLAYDLNPRARLFLRLDNILNAKYETVFGYGTSGFAAYVGFKIR